MSVVCTRNIVIYIKFANPQQNDLSRILLNFYRNIQINLSQWKSQIDEMVQNEIFRWLIVKFMTILPQHIIFQFLYLGRYTVVKKGVFHATNGTLQMKMPFIRNWFLLFNMSIHLTLNCVRISELIYFQGKKIMFFLQSVTDIKTNKYLVCLRKIKTLFYNL